MSALTGSYWSDEAETMLVAAVDQGALVLRRRPDAVIKLTAIGPDKFRGSIGTVTFMRNASGAVGFVQREPGSRLGLAVYEEVISRPGSPGAP